MNSLTLKLSRALAMLLAFAGAAPVMSAELKNLELAATSFDSKIRSFSVRAFDLKATATSGNSVVLTWHPAAPLDLKWIQIEKWLAHQNIWSTQSPIYVSNETTRYEHNGLEGSTTYRYIVCGLKGDKNGKVTGPHTCTNQVTVRTPIALNSQRALLIQPRVPPVFVIGAITPVGAGFQLCTGLTGLAGRYVGGTIQPSNLSSSICDPGNVTITQTNPQMKPTGQKLRLIVVHEAYDGFDYNKTIPGSPRTDIYDLSLANNNPLTFQAAFASGRGIQRWPQEAGYVKAHFGAYAWPLNFLVQYQGTNYARSSCNYTASPVKVSCE